MHIDYSSELLSGLISIVEWVLTQTDIGQQTHDFVNQSMMRFAIFESSLDVSLKPGVSMRTMRRPSLLRTVTALTTFVQDSSPDPTAVAFFFAALLMN
jgi:hypothetical protein